MVAQNAFCLFKIPLNDAFLKGTVEIKEFRFYCKLPLAIHFHLKYFNCVCFSSHLLPYKFLSSLIIRYSSKIAFTLDQIISVPFLLMSKNVEDADPVQVNINIFVACFTTCWARLKLYQEGLSQLEPDQVLYFDTDSIIYSCQEGQKSLPLGDYLGEFTDELEDGDHIVEFASAGPKNYGYRTARGKVECKVRGFSLNTRGREQLNFEFLKENAIREVSDPLSDPREIPVFNPHKITRDVNTKQLETLTEIKRYKLVFDKRVVDTKNYFSYPYGYLRYDEEAEEMLQGLNVAWDEQDDMNVELLCELLCE